VPVSVANFVVTSFDINPGNPGLFPWLSAIALRYETYRFRRLSFFYDTQMPTTTAGSVGLGVDFDVADPPPADLLEFLAMNDSGSASVWTPLRLNVDLSGAHNTFRFTRSGLPSGTWDQRLYDLGRLYHFTNGLVAGNSYGLLSVEYEIEFCTPQVQDPATGHFSFGTGVGGGGGITPAAPFGTAVVSPSHARYPFTIDSVSAIRFAEAFQGIISGACNGTGIAAAAPITAGSTCQVGAADFQSNGAANGYMYYMPIKAAAGELLALAFNAATLTLHHMSLAKGGYDQF
jgi:hypothetical protein